MKKLFRTAFILSSLMGIAGRLYGQQPLTDTMLLFDPVAEGYTLMHCPALLLSRKGTLLAFAEGRTGNGNDWAAMDLLMRRSSDKGEHWGPVTILVPHTQGVPTSNITPIADQDGRIHLLYQVDYSHAYYISSDDEGHTWSKPVDITYAFDQFKPEYNWKVLAPGPGHGIQLTGGRLVVPVWLCQPDPAIAGGDHRPSCIATIYSDDHGKTWKRGDIIADNGDVAVSGDTIRNPSESTITQLADGRVLINARNESSPNRRLVAFSPDGAHHWTKPAFDTALFEPVCMASTIRLPENNQSNGKARIVFVNPDSRADPKVIRKRQPVYRPRENLTARLSYDGGSTWPVKKVLHAGGSGYSDLAAGRDGTIYCIYEIQDGGYNHWQYRVVLRRFNLAWLTGGGLSGVD